MSLRWEALMPDGSLARIARWQPVVEDCMVAKLITRPDEQTYQIEPVKGGWTVYLNSVPLRTLSNIALVKWFVQLDWEKSQGISVYPRRRGAM